ncbi:MAG TPA: hypothetical protein VG347_20965 [Verrucomicrobiae bacterium]|nr:hypothetical protein [Verrucomicrobiae bacterium]
MGEPTVNDVIAWFEDDQAMEDVVFCQEQPELVWQAILEVLQRDLTEEEKGDLLVGPLEELLYFHGAGFIERVEQEGQSSPQFNHLLGGVWRSEMPLEIWERVQKVRKEVW